MKEVATAKVKDGKCSWGETCQGLGSLQLATHTGGAFVPLLVSVRTTHPVYYLYLMDNRDDPQRERAGDGDSLLSDVEVTAMAS